MIQLVRMYIEEAEHFFIGGSPRIDQWLRRWFLVDRMRYSVACGLHNTSATLPTLLFKVLLYWLTGWCYDSTLDVAYQIRCCDSEWMLSAHCSSFTPNPSQTVATSRWNHVLTLFHDLSSSHARRHAGLESAPCLPLPRPTSVRGNIPTRLYVASHSHYAWWVVWRGEADETEQQHRDWLWIEQCPYKSPAMLVLRRTTYRVLTSRLTQGGL